MLFFMVIFFWNVSRQVDLNSNVKDKKLDTCLLNDTLISLKKIKETGESWKCVLIDLVNGHEIFDIDKESETGIFEFPQTGCYSD